MWFLCNRESGQCSPESNEEAVYYSKELSSIQLTVNSSTVSLHKIKDRQE